MDAIWNQKMEKNLIDKNLYESQTKKFKTMWSLDDLNKIMSLYKEFGMHKAANEFSVTSETVIRIAKKFNIKIRKDVKVNAKKIVERESEEYIDKETEERNKEILVMHYYMVIRNRPEHIEKTNKEVIEFAKKMLDFRPS